MKTVFVCALTIAICIAVGALSPLPGWAQQSGIKRTLLLKRDLSIEGREVIMATAEIAPGQAAGRHTHHGEEVGYMLDGSAVLEIEGQPAINLKAGDSYAIEAGKIHDAKAVGDKAAKVLAVYIVEKGKPLAEPAK
jgi:quercetin dioxygenase-like cupin family protein